MQAFKRPGLDMGRYQAQYVYRCPSVTCRHREVHPEVVPALAAIDPTIAGIRIGDRAQQGLQLLARATVARIAAGMRRHWQPLLVPTGGTWRTGAVPLTQPMPTRTTRENDAVAVPPPGTAMNAPAAAWASQLLVPYYGAADAARPASGPIGALTTRDRYGLAQPDPARLVPSGTGWAAGGLDLEDVLFRMLEPHEIARAMAFDAGYQVAARSRRIKVRLYGNAVTPPVAEIIGCALVEAATGESIEPAR